MAKIFHRFSGARGHRRAQSAINTRETLPPNVDGEASAPAASDLRIEAAAEFKPAEHPIEPLNCDQPVTCPLPEPSILNDRRMWKERISSANAQVRADLPVVKDGTHLRPEAGGKRPESRQAKRLISSSLSAPEHNIIALLEECNATGDQNVG